MMVSVLAAVLEFQRDMISENTREGVAAAKASGKTLGRRLNQSSRSRQRPPFSSPRKYLLGSGARESHPPSPARRGCGAAGRRRGRDQAGRRSRCRSR
ncbi:recombinase family protein [Nonomuraea rosea]|uniref:recombinase family protein n=1 Tax=Nonomuraea rosea TaxID=638574 RepID=UPI003CD08004